MSASLEITVDDAGSRELLALLAIGPEEQRQIHARIAAQAGELTRNYLTEMAQTRHETAETLGATPTGFWAQAAESVQARSSDAAATVSIRSPGIGRVDHDVTIEAEDGGYLTIPVEQQAYGVRAAELGRQMDLFVIRTAGALVLAARIPGQKIAQVEYLLVPSVFQKQDRTLLPSDEAYFAAGKAGIRDWVNFQLEAA
jgi:hypothetical protein